MPSHTKMERKKAMERRMKKKKGSMGSKMPMQEAMEKRMMK